MKFPITSRMATAALLLSSLSTLAAEISSFSPVGNVKRVQQVLVKFKEEVIAMGDPRSKVDPLLMDCKAVGIPKKGMKGQAPALEIPKAKSRWVDNKVWSLDFDKELPGGVRCVFTINSEFKDKAGAGVTSSQPDYTFSTSGPALLDVYPNYGEVTPDQYFVAELDGEIDAASVAKGAYFVSDGVADANQIEIIRGSDRESVLEAAVQQNWRWSKYKQGNKLKMDGATKSLFLVFKAKRRFPEGQKIEFHWTTDIKSKSGLNVTEAQKYSFVVLPPFSASLTCERTQPERPCIPISRMTLFFSRRVPLESLKNVRLKGPNKESFVPAELIDGDQNQNISTSVGGKVRTGVSLISNFEDKQVSALSFDGPFPENAELVLDLPKGLKDELDRELSNADKFPLKVATDEATPLVKFQGAFGILERNIGAALPVHLRNVEPKLPSRKLSFEGKQLNLKSLASAKSIVDWYAKVQAKHDNWELRDQSLLASSGAKDFSIDKPAGAKEFEVMGIPLKESGFYVVEMSSPKLGAALTASKKPMYVVSSVLVTDMAVHLKRGRESSLVWVTRLSDGKPVSDAEVLITSFQGNELARGKTDSSGIFRVGAIDYPCKDEWIEGAPSPKKAKNSDSDDYSDGEWGNACKSFAFAQKGDDFSFVASDWNRGIETYRFNVGREYLDRNWGPFVSHTILNRMLAQAGDVIEMKHVLREHHLNNFSAVRSSVLPKRVLVMHTGSRRVFTLPFQYDPQTGTALNQFEIPKDAPLGYYAIFLSNKEKLPKASGDDEAYDWDSRMTGSFSVAEYRLPLMKAELKVDQSPSVNPSSITADLSASYLSGGPAAGQKVKLRSSLLASYYSPNSPDAEGYSFLSSPHRVGTFDETNSSRYESDATANYMDVQDLTLDKNGGVVAKIPSLPKVNKVHELAVEMEYTDPNGEIKTAATTKQIFPAEILVGLKSESWFAKGGSAQVAGVVVDLKGKVVPNHPVIVEAFASKEITHRKKLVGGFYSYDTRYVHSRIGKVCDLKTDSKGRFTCVAKGLDPGSVALQAQVKDAKGNVAYGSTEVSIYREGQYAWWTPSDSDRIDLVPEKKGYQPGDLAKFVVQSPFPSSQVLITIEREGVIDSFVKEIKRDKPFVEILIKDNYAPNVFVSAVAIRGRVGEPAATALIDLAKPAMKMGLVGIDVGWMRHELKVTLSTPKQVYKTREQVPVTIKVSTASGVPLPKGSEVAVAAVDEALLQLKNNESWKLLAAMMGSRELAVETSSGQNQIIGKRHFGSKAKNPGGDGGGLAGDERTLFEAMRLWSPRVKLNEAGEAQIKVPLNDSITSFRIAAIATGGLSMFGSGETSVQSNKDLIIYSGFPPLLREGDQSQATFTIRNTTDKDMKVEISLQSKNLSMPKFQSVDLKAHEAKTLTAALKIPAGIKDFAYSLQVTDRVSGTKDAMSASVRVLDAVPARVLQATLFQLDKKNEISVQQPADAIKGRGGLRVTAKDTLVRGLSGVKSFMMDYEYSCLEQQFSRAVALEDKKAMEKVVASFPIYFDSYDLLKFFPISICGSAMLTRYLLKIAKYNQVSIPDATLNRALAGLQNFVTGKNGTCANWWDSLVHDKYASERKILAMEVLSLYGKFDKSWVSTVQITPNLWTNESVAAWYGILKRQPEINGSAELLKQADNILRARVNYQGTLMNLQGEPDWEGAWRLFTSRDQEAFSVFQVALDNPQWSADAGRMARGVVARLKRGVWDTTLANAWGVTTLRNFSQAFEKDKVSGQTQVEAVEVKGLFDWAKEPSGKQQLFAWPSSSASKEAKVSFQHAGSGKPWVTLETISAVPLKEPLDLGYKIQRKLSPVTQKNSGKWSVGDVVNVELSVTAKYDQAWVVIKDPVPGGASHLGTGLAGSSKILDKTTTSSGGGNEWPTEFEEKKFDSFVSYAAYLPKGTYTTSYRIRLNSAGVYRLPPARVEAMYAPETFGEVPIADWKIEQ